MVGAIVGAVANLAGSWMQGRQKVTQAKADAKIARLQNGIPGYSDEFLVAVWVLPFVMAFVPPLQPYATAGFEIIETMPDWYMAGFMTVTAGVFGIDKFLMFKGKS